MSDPANVGTKPSLAELEQSLRQSSFRQNYPTLLGLRPAFPGQMPTGFDARSGNFVEGMTLLDWFAGMALQGILASGKEENDFGGAGKLGLTSEAYTYAVCMMDSRADELDSIAKYLAEQEKYLAEQENR